MGALCITVRSRQKEVGVIAGSEEVSSNSRRENFFRDIECIDCYRNVDWRICEHRFLETRLLVAFLSFMARLLINLKRMGVIMSVIYLF